MWEYFVRYHDLLFLLKGYWNSSGANCCLCPGKCYVVNALRNNDTLYAKFIMLSETTRPSMHRTEHIPGVIPPLPPNSPLHGGIAIPFRFPKKWSMQIIFTLNYMCAPRGHQSAPPHPPFSFLFFGGGGGRVLSFHCPGCKTLTSRTAYLAPSPILPVGDLLLPPPPKCSHMRYDADYGRLHTCYPVALQLHNKTTCPWL